MQHNILNYNNRILAIMAKWTWPWTAAGEAISDVANSLLSEAFEGVIQILVEVVLKIFEWTEWVLGVTLELLRNQLSATPALWDGSGKLFEGIQNFSKEIIVPIGLVIITFVMAYEIYNMVIKENSLAQDGQELFTLFRIIGKMAIADYLLGHCFEITEAFFEVGAEVCDSAITYLNPNEGGVIQLEVIVSNAIGLILEEESVFTQIGYMAFMVVVAIVTFFTTAVAGIISLFALGERFVEIYIYLAVSPIAFATLGNQEMSQMGKNYLKNIIALAFQGMFIVIVLAIYLYLLTNVGIDDPEKETFDISNLFFTLIKIVIASFTLGVTMYKSRGISKSIFNAH